MQIDWITVGAQIANFLVLVWLLQRLLYRPITRAMERREAEIRDRFAEAERREAEAEAERERLAGVRDELDAEREALIAEARDAAQDLRRRLEEAAREEAAGRRETWLAQVRDGEEAFLRDLRRRTAGHVEKVARRALGDFANAGLEEAMVETFVGRLEALEGAARRRLREAAGQAPVAVESAFDLPPPAKAQLTRAVREIAGDRAEVAYERNPELLCGVRLRAGGQTVQWSLDAYLDDLEEDARAFLDGAGPREAAAE